MDRIYVNEMLFYGYHGVFPEENKLGQRFIVDIVASLSLRKAGESDDLNHSVNYGELYQLSQKIVEGKPVQLIETLGERIAAQILEDYPAIEEVTVKITKPDPPIPGYYRSVAIEVTRGRK
ncbi:MAG: dihydroneopterin aldolase [Bacillaceae bacterium]